MRSGGIIASSKCTNAASLLPNQWLDKSTTRACEMRVAIISRDRFTHF